MKVVIADAIHADGEAHLAKAGVQVSKGPFKPDALAQAVADADGLIVRSATKVTKDVLAAAPKLKVVGRAGIGVDNIDVEACKARGITVVNTPAATSNAVAELTIAHVLALARHLPRGTAGIRDAKWEKKELEGVELKGRTLGLLG
ncbi:MAG: 3-phosphoglycerate dehydrogenase, partial [bacterium]